MRQLRTTKQLAMNDPKTSDNEAKEASDEFAPPNKSIDEGKDKKKDKAKEADSEFSVEEKAKQRSKRV